MSKQHLSARVPENVRDDIVIGAVVGQSWALALVTPFALTTFVFAMLWASVRVLAGRDLV